MAVHFVRHELWSYTHRSRLVREALAFWQFHCACHTNWLVSITQMSPCVQHMKCTSTKPLADWWTIAMICNKPGPVLAALCSSKFMLLSRSCSVSALMKSSNSRSPGGSCVEGLTQEGAGRESSVTLLTLGEKTKTQRDIANTGRENQNTVWHY